METRPYGVDDPNPESPPYGFKSRLPVPPRAMTWSPVAPANGPENVDVPAPFTVMRFATSRFVVDAFGKILMSAVDVEIKIDDLIESSAVKTPPIRAEPLLTEKAVPGVEVLTPREPADVTTRRVVVARVEPDRVGS